MRWVEFRCGGEAKLDLRESVGCELDRVFGDVDTCAAEATRKGRDVRPRSTAQIQNGSPGVDQVLGKSGNDPSSRGEPPVTVFEFRMKFELLGKHFRFGGIVTVEDRLNLARYWNVPCSSDPMCVKPKAPFAFNGPSRSGRYRRTLRILPAGSGLQSRQELRQCAGRDRVLPVEASFPPPSQGLRRRTR